MTVRASNLAFLDLGEHLGPTGVAAHQVNDLCPLVRAMIKLKDDGVCFTAIDARMRQ